MSRYPSLIVELLPIFGSLHEGNAVQLDDIEVVYEEVKEPHVIETGDSVKLKQVLDDATISAVESAGYVANYSWDM